MSPPELPDCAPVAFDPTPATVEALDALDVTERNLVDELRSVCDRRGELLIGAADYLGCHSTSWKIDRNWYNPRGHWRVYHVKEKPTSTVHLFRPDIALRTAAQWIKEDRQP